MSVYGKTCDGAVYGNAPSLDYANKTDVSKLLNFIMEKSFAQPFRRSVNKKKLSA